jgi:predicted transcriptional regulator
MYTPKLSTDLVQRLYPLCQRLAVPMTRFVNEAVAQALKQAEEGLEQRGTEPALAENRAGAGLAVA